MKRLLYLGCRLKIVFVVFFQLVFLESLCTSQKPQILSKDENIVEVGDNFTVLCQGDSPITWTWPDKQDSVYTEWTTVEIFDDVPIDSAYKHASRLFIQNATFVYTGFYKCFYNNTDGSRNNHSETYLYVRDDEHLSVEDLEVDVVLVVQYSDAVIPCRPTSPEVRVELSYITGELIPLDTISDDGTIFQYDPHYGFITNHTRQPEQNLFYCSFKKDSREAQLTIIMDIEPKTFLFPKPLLEEVIGVDSSLGEKIVLKCAIRTNTYVTFNWTTPTGPPDLSRMEISRTARDSEDRSLTVQWLTVNRSLPEDIGTYYCMVSDNQNHRSTVHLDVKICEPWISLKEKNNASAFSVEVGSAFVEWHIDVRGRPEPTLLWLNNNNQIIPEGSSEKYITKTSSNEAVLKIVNITLDDFGRYTLVAINKYQKQSLVLFLNRDNRPYVFIAGDKNYP